MDREGFRNRLKQYKEARGLNPLLKYWEWKALPAEKEVPKYEEGTDLIGKKEIQWFKDWYNKRVEYAIANNRPDIIKQLESLLYYFYPKLYEYSLGVDWDDSIYTGTLDPKINGTKISINEQAIKDYEKKHGVEIGGYWHPSEGVVLPSNYNSNDLLHELAHTFNHTESITNAVNSAISDENGFVTIPAGLQNPEYWISPWEVHSRLMQFREENNIDPTKVYNEEDIKQLRKSAKDKILFEIFNDSQMMHLLNDVADNVTTPADDRLFLKNGGIVPKYGGGTNFVTYNPDELQRNIQRVLHTTPEGEVNPFYNSLDDTYGSVELPEVTITAPYTRKASLAQQARLGREAYYKAGKKAAPVLAAIPIGAGILGAASVFGFGPVLDIIDVVSDPTNPLSYVDKFDLSKIKKVDPMSKNAKPISNKIFTDNTRVAGMSTTKQRYLDYGELSFEDGILNERPQWVKNVQEFYDTDVMTRERNAASKEGVFYYLPSYKNRSDLTFNHKRPVYIREYLDDVDFGGYADDKMIVLSKNSPFAPDETLVHEGAHFDQSGGKTLPFNLMVEPDIKEKVANAMMNRYTDPKYRPFLLSVLDDAYEFTEDFGKNIHKTLEKGATNREIRYNLWLKNNKPNVNELDSIIDEMSDDDIIYMLTQTNAYSRNVHKNLLEKGKDKKDVAASIRTALKTVPMLSAPIILNSTNDDLVSFADGGEVIGPPTYEEWLKDVNKYNPTIWDEYSMLVSLDEAQKAFGPAMRQLPGYDEIRARLYPSMVKSEPNIANFVEDTWENENPNNLGLKNGKYYPHKSPEGGSPTIGPGFKIGSGSHNITAKEAKQGVTKYRLDKELENVGKENLAAVNKFINNGLTTNPADTVSPQIKQGLMDLRYQVGPLGGWKELQKAVLEGDIHKIQEEAKVKWKDKGVMREDTRRNDLRNKKYFHY